MNLTRRLLQRNITPSCPQGDGVTTNAPQDSKRFEGASGVRSVPVPNGAGRASSSLRLRGAAALASGPPLPHEIQSGCILSASRNKNNRNVPFAPGLKGLVYTPSGQSPVNGARRSPAATAGTRHSDPTARASRFGKLRASHNPPGRRCRNMEPAPLGCDPGAPGP